MCGKRIVNTLLTPAMLAVYQSCISLLQDTTAYIIQFNSYILYYNKIINAVQFSSKKYGTFLF